jgi:hypothetical protein
VLLLAVLALGATVGVRPPAGPPLYDGIGFPDEPYRWLKPPVGQPAGVQPPTSASARVEVVAGATAGARGYSSEQGPQVAFAAPDGAFATPAGTTSVLVSAVPQVVPATRPDGGVVVSNLYRFGAAAGSTPVPLAATASLTINLRANQETRQTVVLAAWDGSSWTQLPTRQVGVEIYAAQLMTLGAVAAVRLDQGVTPSVEAPLPSSGPDPVSSTPAAGSGSIRGTTLWLTVGAVVVLLAGSLLVLRRRTGDG